MQAFILTLILTRINNITIIEFDLVLVGRKKKIIKASVCVTQTALIISYILLYFIQ